MTATAITTEITVNLIDGQTTADEALAIYADARHPGIGWVSPAPEDDNGEWDAETSNTILAALLPGSTITSITSGPGDTAVFTVLVPAA